MVYSLGRTYALRKTLATRMMMFMPLFILAAGLVVGTLLLVQHGPVLPGVAIVPIWLLVVLIFWGQLLRSPHTIEWTSEGTIVFRSYVGTTTMVPSEIISIEPHPGMLGTLRIRYGKKKLNIISQFDDLHEFLHRLKTESPTVELRGC